jgi:uncharacterized membrane protein YfcA
MSRLRPHPTFARRGWAALEWPPLGGSVYKLGLVGSAVGGLLVVYVPAGGVKLLLGCVLIASALRVFKTRAPGFARRG